jgi:iron complex transport system substrate-binding protein
LTGKQDETAKLVAGLKQRVEVVKQQVAKDSSKPKVYYELDGTDPAKPYTTGPGSYLDSLLTLVGATNIGGKLQSPWAVISSEEVVAQNPDVILLGDAAYGISVESVGQRPGWDKIKAVVDKKVFPFDDNTVSRPTPRLVDGVEALYKILHP